MVKKISAISISILMSACASAPVQEMSDARQALTLAKSAGAEQHSPSAYSLAQRYLTSAEHELGRQNYSRAKFSALRAKQQAMCAREVSVAAGSLPHNN